MYGMQIGFISRDTRRETRRFQGDWATLGAADLSPGVSEVELREQMKYINVGVCVVFYSIRAYSYAGFNASLLNTGCQFKLAFHAAVLHYFLFYLAKVSWGISCRISLGPMVPRIQV
jgi:hypothetical protein